MGEGERQRVVEYGRVGGWVVTDNGEKGKTQEEGEVKWKIFEDEKYLDKLESKLTG
jgi:hypothetical protein